MEKGTLKVITQAIKEHIDTLEHITIKDLQFITDF